MAFTITKDDLKKSQKCPPGMHLATVIEVGDEYFNDKGTSVQEMSLETDKGYQIRTWFNDKFQSALIEFVEAADKIKFDMETMADTSINLKEYIGRKVAISVSHGKDKNNKVQAQIDNFYSADKVPF